MMARQYYLSLDRTRLKTQPNIVDVPIAGAIKVTRYSIGALLLVALFVRSACKLPSYMVLLLHGVIRFFVISCSANIYKAFFN